MRKKRLLIAGLCALGIGLAFWGAARMMQSGADIACLLALQAFRASAGGFFTILMQVFTALGEFSVPLLLSILLYWCVDKKAGARMLMLCVSSTGLNQLIKATACVYRPWVRDARITPLPEALTTATGYSFPSGHTANAGAWILGLWAWAGDKRKNTPALTWALALLWALVGFSRVFLGVHTPQDVGVMVVIMLPLMLLCEWALTYASRGARQELVVALCGAAIGVVLAVWASVKSYPLDLDAAGKLLVDPAAMTVDVFRTAGMVVGFFMGWLVERRFIGFEVMGKPWRRVLRGVAGAAMMLALDKLLTPLMVLPLGAAWGQFFSKIVVFMVVAAGYPALVRKVQGMGRKADAAG